MKPTVTIASRKMRFFSLLLDILFYCDVTWVIQVSLQLSGSETTKNLQLLYICFFAIFYLTNGMSPANKTLNFSIKKTDGSTVKFISNVIRVGFAGTCFSFIPILFTYNHVGVHDLFAGTVVYQKPIENKVVIKFLTLLLILTFFVLLAKISSI